MKKHSFSVILLAASLLSAGFVTSCKDTDADLLTEIGRNQNEQNTLQTELQQTQKDLQDQIDALTQAKADLIDMLAALAGKADTGSVNTALGGKVDTTTFKDQLGAKADTAKVTELLNDLQNKLEGELNGKLDEDALENLWKEQWMSAMTDSTLTKDLTTALVGSNTVASIQDITIAIENAQNSLAGIDTTLQKQVLANVESINSLKTQLATVNSAVEAAQSTANAALELAKSDSTILETVQENLTSVTNTLNGLSNVRDSLVILDNKATEAQKTAANAYVKAVTLETNYTLLKASLEKADSILDAKIADANDKIGSLDGKVDSLNAGLNGKIDAATESLKAYVDSLHNVVTGALVDSCAALRATAKALSDQALADAKTYADGLTLPLYESINSLKTSVSEINSTLYTYNSRITANEENIAKLQEQIDDVNETLDGFETRISKLESEVAALRKDVDDVKSDLAKLITGIIIQGTEDPIFGYAALPFGIQTNILAGYYGDALNAEIEFPTVKTGRYVDAKQVFTADEQRVAGFKSEVAEADTIYAGKIYVTINPTNIDFTGEVLTLESSAQNASPVLLKGLKKSTTELSFGVTKAARSNGFYEAEAYILPKNASKASPNFDLASVKSVAKQLLNEKTVSASNVVSALYNNVSNICPRYGATVSWENSNGETVGVYSNYGLATIAIKPLSYSFLYGKTYDLGYSLPTIDENLISDAVENLTKDFKVNFDFGEIDLGLSDISFDFSAFDSLDLSLTINWDSIKINTTMDSMDITFVYGVPEYDVKLTYDTTYLEADTAKETPIVTVSAIQLEETGSHPATGSTRISLQDQMSGLYGTIEDQINAAMESVIGQIKTFSSKLDGFTDSMKGIFDQLDGFTTKITGLQENIDKMFSNISGDLEKQIDNILSSLTDNISSTFTGYITTVNSYITRINSVINRVTSLISNPNSKLQPVMIYGAKTGTSAIVSTSKTVPTTMQLSGSGEQAAKFIVTSYTAELFAPAFKKYVAVVDVINGDKSAQKGDANCLAAAKLANKTAANFNKVLDGGQRAVVFTTDSKYAGYTYVIAYAALDYSGYMVTNRYYVKVIK
jgi:archaellum component FlaC